VLRRRHGLLILIGNIRLRVRRLELRARGLLRVVALHRLHRVKVLLLGILLFLVSHLGHHLLLKVLLFLHVNLLELLILRGLLHQAFVLQREARGSHRLNIIIKISCVVIVIVMRVWVTDVRWHVLTA
jgi:hypothetical protein